HPVCAAGWTGGAHDGGDVWGGLPGLCRAHLAGGAGGVLRGRIAVPSLRSGAAICAASPCRPRFPCLPRHATMLASGAEEAMRIFTMLFAAAVSVSGLELCAATPVAADASADPAASGVTAQAVPPKTAQLAPQAAPQLRSRPPAAKADVDVALVIAVDVSYSM